MYNWDNPSLLETSKKHIYFIEIVKRYIPCICIISKPLFQSNNSIEKEKTRVRNKNRGSRMNSKKVSLRIRQQG